MSEQEDCTRNSIGDNENDEDEHQIARRGFMGAFALSPFVSSSFGSYFAAVPPRLERLWGVNLKYPQNTLVALDVDGDGEDEIAVASKDRFGPSQFGIVDEGTWAWQRSVSEAVRIDDAADVNGDGIDEAIFTGRSGGRWVRPYTRNGSFLWDGSHGDFPDRVYATDFDNDGKAEISADSGNRGDLTVWDDDGTVLWQTQAPNLIDRTFGFRDVVGDNMGELISTQPPDENFRGIQLVQRDANSGANQVWSYGPNDPAEAGFFTLSGNDTPDILVVYLNTGEVHAVDAQSGTNQWTESTNLSNVDAQITDAVGDRTKDAILWNGGEMWIIDGATRDRFSVSLDDDIEQIAPIGNDRIAVVTAGAIVVLDIEEGVLSREPISRPVTEIEVGDIDGDGTKELIVGFDDELVAYRTGSANQPNQPPIAVYSYSPEAPETSQHVTFDGSDSTDTDGSIVSYKWTFGDNGGVTKTGKTVDYEFSTPGPQTVTLDVVDDRGANTAVSKTLNVPLLRATEKQSIAEHIDEGSITNLNDYQQASDNISSLTDAVQTGALETETAEDTGARLVAAESVTETVLENIGPAQDDVGEQYNLIRDLSLPLLRTLLNLAVGAYGARSGTGSNASLTSLAGVGDVLTAFGNELLKNTVTRAMDWFFGSFQVGKQETKSALFSEARDIVSRFQEGGAVTRDALKQAIESGTEVLADIVVSAFRRYFEQGIVYPIPGIPLPQINLQNTLDTLHAQLDSEAAKQGLKGSTEAAVAAARNKRFEIDNQTDLVTEDIRRLKEFEDDDLFGSLVDLFNGELSGEELLEVFIRTANSLVGSLTTAASVGAGLQGLAELQVQNAIATYLVIEGREQL